MHMNVREIITHEDSADKNTWIKKVTFDDHILEIVCKDNRAVD